MSEKTIAAISTAQGQGGIGIIRISGEDAIKIGDRVFSSASGKTLSESEGYRAHYGKVVEEGEMLDEVVAVVYRAPHSYTGEDVVELCCHGGLYITRQILRTVLSQGAVLAEPGEFTKRAFLNEKMDLTEAQAVMDIISAQSRQAARAAISTKTGALSRRIESIVDELVTLVAHFVAWADYPEEDIPEITDEALTRTFSSVKESINELLRDYEKGQAIIKGIDTVIAGRPNVGKSTLMNLLSGYDKSIVTEIPGTTRDVVEETVIVGDVTLRLSDTAGLRDTDNIVEKIGVDRTRERLSSCALVLAVFDFSQELTDEDRELLDNISDVPVIAIINKTDLVQKLDYKYIENKINHVVYISAKNGSGKDELEEKIATVSGTKDFDPSVGILSGERQRQAASKALSSVIDAENALLSGFSYDAVTVCVEDAIDHLLSLTGENSSDIILDEMFHTFCVGK